MPMTIQKQKKSNNYKIALQIVHYMNNWRCKRKFSNPERIGAFCQMPILCMFLKMYRTIDSFWWMFFFSARWNSYTSKLRGWTFKNIWTLLDKLPILTVWAAILDISIDCARHSFRWVGAFQMTYSFVINVALICFSHSACFFFASHSLLSKSLSHFLLFDYTFFFFFIQYYSIKLAHYAAFQPIWRPSVIHLLIYYALIFNSIRKKEKKELRQKCRGAKK